MGSRAVPRSIWVSTDTNPLRGSTGFALFDENPSSLLRSGVERNASNAMARHLARLRPGGWRTALLEEALTDLYHVVERGKRLEHLPPVGLVRVADADA